MGQDSVTCLVCGKEFARINCLHLKRHNMTIDEYKNKYVGAKLVGKRELSIFTKRKMALKELALKSDIKCQYCGADYKDVHHIIPRSMGGTHDFRNLVVLCEECHLKAHNGCFKGWRGVNEHMLRFFQTVKMEVMINETNNA